VRPVDNLWTTRRKDAQVIHIIDLSLTSSVRSIAESERLKPCSSLRRIALLGVLCLWIGLSVINMQPVQAATQADHLKLYAHSRIIDDKQYHCFRWIITKESRWNPKARNGSHYGLGQMRSTWYRDLDPYRQIDQTIKYITKRYGSPCKARLFHEKKGWY
jgi:hypothetical protein